MKISQQGVNKLEQREGKRNKAYKDTKGIWTIGVGHTGPNVYEGLAWTDQQIEDALRDDLAWAEQTVNESVKVILTQNQYDALVSFVFNIGATAFKKSTLLKLLNQGLYDMAAEAFLMWNKPPEIIGRRNSEREQFLA
jgi:GH24 family phage-related lysozyme (muramidase)